MQYLYLYESGFFKLIFSQEEVGEPSLTYWHPNPTPVANLSKNYDNLLNTPFKQLNGTNHPQDSCFEYPLPDVTHSFIQDQQVRLSMGAHEGYDGQRRRVPSQLQLNPEGLLSAISGPSQQGNLMNDALIHDEVTRAAKTLFSKRNRTLLHWLNPDVSKNQLKIDVNAAWDSLPATEKVFYISQVLGKFAPHTTSLMVNPQLGGENLILAVSTGNSITTEYKANFSSDSGCSPTASHRCKFSKSPIGSRKHEIRIKKRKGTHTSDDDGVSCDSGFVMGKGLIEGPQEEQKSKRKYTKKKSKQNVTTITEEGSTNSPTSVDSSVQKIDLTELKKITTDSNIPKVKRKYTKRKLVRKKYKKRETKTRENVKSSEATRIPSFEEKLAPGESMPSQISYHVPESLEEMDVYIELDDDSFSHGMEAFQLLNNEDVDYFWDNIGDPESLFDKLDIT